MSADKPKPGNSKNLPASPAVPARKIVLFRRVDWITFALTTLLVFIGITSPWLRTWIGRFRGACGRIDVRGCAPSARVPGMDALHMAFHADPVLEYRLAGGVVVGGGGRVCMRSAGLDGVAREQLLLEGIADFKGLDRRLEEAICCVSGFVAGMLLGFNGIAWSQAVIVEVYTFSVLSYMAVLVCLFRWIYAPEQRKYLYWTFFWFGICFTNHQTLIVAAIGWKSPSWRPTRNSAAICSSGIA